MIATLPTGSPPTIERAYEYGGQVWAVRLRSDIWAAFDEVCVREEVRGEVLCARAARRLGDDPLADKIVALLTSYYKDAADADQPSPPGLSDAEGAFEPSPALLAALNAVGKPR